MRYILFMHKSIFVVEINSKVAFITCHLNPELMSKYVSSQPAIHPVSLGKNYLHWLNLRVHIFYIKILIVFYLKYKYKYLNAIFLINKKRDFKLVFANDFLQTHTVK